ncbi:hypothetical protein [Roseateles sp. L2-2]|uniref:hypothetical protein n=1 Tax=Roseateles sp. L2-2 TaxID=3422597 RepID=UPI003D35AD71
MKPFVRHRNHGVEHSQACQLVVFELAVEDDAQWRLPGALAEQARELARSYRWAATRHRHQRPIRPRDHPLSHAISREYLRENGKRVLSQRPVKITNPKAAQFKLDQRMSKKRSG